VSDSPFDLSAIGRSGDERSYEATEDALRAYAEATDDVPGGPVFALLPVWEAAGRASRSVVMVYAADTSQKIVGRGSGVFVSRDLLVANTRRRDIQSLHIHYA